MIGRQGYFGKDMEAMSFAKNYHRWIYSPISLSPGEQITEIGAGIVGNFTGFLNRHSRADVSAGQSYV